MKKIMQFFKTLPLWQSILFGILAIALIAELVSIGAFVGQRNRSIESTVIGASQQTATTTTSGSPVAVEAFVVGSGQAGTLTRSGILKSETEIILSPKIGGRLVERLVERGDKVASGQLIARLDQDQALIAAAQNALVNLSLNRANTERTRTIIQEDKQQAQIQLENAQTDLIVKQKAFEAGRISLANAQNNKKNTEEQNQQDLNSIVQSSIEALRSAQTAADTTLTVLSDLINDVLAGQSLKEVAVRESWLASEEQYKKIQPIISALSSDLTTTVSKTLQGALDVFETMRVGLRNATIALNDPDIEVTKANLGINITASKTIVSERRMVVDGMIREFSSLQEAIRTTTIINQGRIDVSEGTLRIAEIQFDSTEQGVTFANQAIASAEANVRAVEPRLAQQLAFAQSQVDITENQLAAAQSELDKSFLRSPASGVVADVFVDPGALIGPGTPIVKIINPAALKVEVSVSADEARRIDTTRQVMINGVYLATIREIQPVADQQTRQTIITILIDNSKGLLLPESFTTVSLSLRGATGSELTIPVQSVVIGVDETRVAKVIDNRIVWTPVILGEQYETSVVVKSGLQRGDAIIEENPDFLEDGLQVILQKIE
ncbi:MAG: hypothetical protein A2666_03410 [Parcubacteria group bacterium RIFCSPHIGHO2_01_FULL_47_10b]|nr:MAG: hypothetical protein A2666_03410 [Parcubacteria group bacterium RIFCSPHIGHO2_01_FULL_47_10b]